MTTLRTLGSEFQSTLPVWGATVTRYQLFVDGEISIHAPRVGSDARVLNLVQLLVISIHAPRVGSDRRDPHPRGRADISIHAPRVGSDP